jgi:hypothetical protein
MTRPHWLISALLLAALVGCEKEAPKVTDTGAPAPSARPSARPEPPPAPPHAPVIIIDEQNTTIDGKTLSGPPSDWPASAASLLSGKPQVAGETVVVNALRDAKAPKVLAIVAALKAAKAKSITVHTETRDKTIGELELTLDPGTLPDCTAVAMIEKDVAVALWSKGGGGAQRFARGMAGPDLSTSTEALRRRAAGCDSPAWIVGALDVTQWGLVFDLATRARAGVDGGERLRPRETVLLLTAPTPGRKVTGD